MVSRRILLGNLLSICLFLAKEVISSGHIPPGWSQHSHEGKTYFYNQQTGTSFALTREMIVMRLCSLIILIDKHMMFTGVTQWERPLETSSSNRDVDDNVDYMPSNTANPDVISKSGENVGVDLDPWDAVDVDDDDVDYIPGKTAGLDLNREYGPDRDSDDEEDWNENTFHQSSRQETKKVSKVTKTISKFKTSFKSLKEMMKTKKLIQNLHKDDTSQRLTSQPIKGFNPYGTDGSAYPDPDTSDEVDLNEYDSSLQQRDRSTKDPGHLSSLQRENTENIRQDLQNKDGNFRQRRKSQPQQSYEAPIKPSRQNEKIHNDEQISKKSDAKNITSKEEELMEEEKKFLKLNQISSDKDQSFKQKIEYDEKKKKDKISVRLMGKMDRDLWSDYSDTDTFKKSNTFKDSNLAENKITISSKFIGLSKFTLKSKEFFIKFVPLSIRIVISLLPIVLSAAPFQMLLMMVFSLLSDLLAPLLLIFVAKSLTYLIETSFDLSQIIEPIIITPSKDLTPECTSEEAFKTPSSESQHTVKSAEADDSFTAQGVKEADISSIVADIGIYI
jgi:hypothetical protein